MKNLLTAALLIFFTILAQANTDDNALLFNVTGAPSSVNITSTMSHYYPAAGIRLTTPGARIASGCTMIANGYCLFGVSNSSAATITTTGAGTRLDMNVCLDGNGPLSCQRYTVSQHFAYITNGYGGLPFVSACALNSANGAIVSCQDAAANAGVNTVLAPSNGIGGIVLNSDASIAYLSTSGNYADSIMYQCAINSRGLFETCIEVTINPFFYSYYGELALNHAGNMLYLADENSSPNVILACHVNAGIVDGNCVDTGATTTSSSVVQLAVNNTDTVAYIGNYSDPFVTVCDISINGETFSSCIQKNGDNGAITFVGPAAIVLNSTGTLLYVGDYNTGNVYACSTTPNGSAPYFSSCFTAVSGLSPNPWTMTLNSSNTTAYITTYSSTHVCAINPNGTFGSCSISTDAPNAVGIAVSN